jgi:membrane-associated protease RseP (regulator of RpoE activity)
MNPWIVLVLALLASHFLFILIGRKRFDKLSLSLMGPFILWHTKRGLDYLDKAAGHRKFWDVFHPIALALCYIAMVGMIALLIADVMVYIRAPEAIGGMDPRLVLGLPGINPIIPIGYGIIGLVVTMVFHELSHGIVSRHQGITVKSMGILFFILPMGAFVEPDDKEIENSEPSKRLRIEEAGAGMNMIVGIAALLIVALLAGSMAPKAEGVPVLEASGPIAQAGIKVGDIITAINGMEIKSTEAFVTMMENFTPGEVIRVRFIHDGTLMESSVSLADLGVLTGVAENAGKAGMGISYDPYFSLSVFPDALANPFSVGNIMFFLTAPLQGTIPFSEPLLSFYATPFNPQAFSVIANIIYWISWFNLLVGSFNVLPVSILDGYAIFRDSLLSAGEKLRIAKEKRERFANTVARAFSWFFGILLIFIIITSIA